MVAYLVGYDLNRPGQDYPELIEAIKSFPNWWHYLDSTWIVRSSLSPVDIRDRLKAHIDANDELFVARLAGEENLN